MVKKLLEKGIYALGVNLSHYDVDYELSVLDKCIPDSFRGNQVIDLGCGDGRFSKKIASVLEPSSFVGVDLSKGLVRSAVRRGLDARVHDVEHDDISGELGILWGVVHHFENPASGLRRVVSNFDRLIIREPVSERRFLEQGHCYNKAQLFAILREAGLQLDSCTIVDLKKSQAVLILAQCVQG